MQPSRPRACEHGRVQMTPLSIATLRNSWYKRCTRPSYSETRSSLIYLRDTDNKARPAAEFRHSRDSRLPFYRFSSNLSPRADVTVIFHLHYPYITLRELRLRIRIQEGEFYKEKIKISRN